jgi:hypothetical protein
MADLSAQPTQIGLDVFTPLLVNAQVWTQQVAEANASIQREWLHFIDKRFKEDAALGQCLVDCKAPDDFVRACTVFCQTAFEDYQKEFSTLARLGTSLTTEAIAGAQSANSSIGTQYPPLNGKPEGEPASRRRDLTPPAANR